MRQSQIDFDIRKNMEAKAKKFEKCLKSKRKKTKCQKANS